jgi:prepilin-type processing-associated H-X9-DG protein
VQGELRLSGTCTSRLTVLWLTLLLRTHRVDAHGHLINTVTDPDGGLDDFLSYHATGANFVFADGSVRLIWSVLADGPNGGYTGESLVLQALATRAGHEVIPADWAQ